MSTTQQTPPATPPGSGTATPNVPSTPASTSGSATPSNINAIAEAKTAPDGKTQDDTSKLKTFLSILRKFIGVSDIAAVRFSLPAQLLEPTPNLEYWGYLDRPETFIAIGDSEDELGRMLACLKFWFTKDLKYVKGKPCKPYNSTLGEFFRCQWEVKDDVPPVVGEENKQNQKATVSAPNGDSTKGQPIKVSYLTEQTSHHPPVSAFYIDCPDKGISARGYDQLSAKFTGTSVKVIPGMYNKGIFINLQRRGNEEYQMTHPAAFLGGFLKGNLNVTVADTCFITCAKTGIKVILHYLEEGYFGRTQNKVQGVIYKCDVASDNITKISDVNDKDILGRLEGCWRDQVYFAYGSKPWKKVSDSDKILIIDLVPLEPQKKICPPDHEQLPNESRRFWRDVTEAIINKQYSTATTRKQELEEQQRQVAAKRKADMKDWIPIYFSTTINSDGRPELNQLGEGAMQGMHDNQWHLEIPKEFGQMWQQ